MEFPVSSEDLINRIKEDLKGMKFVYGNFEYDFEIVNLTEEQMKDLLFDGNCSTLSFGHEFNEQRRWQRSKIKELERLKGHFWWLAVEKDKRLFAFDQRTDDKFESNVYLLIRFASNEYVGLKTKRNYYDAG